MRTPRADHSEYGLCCLNLQELRDSAIISTMDLETAVMPDGYTSHTVAEAAAVLSVSPSTVRAHLRQGTLPGDKIDGQWVVYLAEPADGPLRTTAEEASGSSAASRRSRVGGVIAHGANVIAWAGPRLRHAVSRGFRRSR